MLAFNSSMFGCVPPSIDFFEISFAKITAVLAQRQLDKRTSEDLSRES